MAGRRQFGSLRHLPSGRWQARYRLPSGETVPAPVTFPTKGGRGTVVGIGGNRSHPWTVVGPQSGPDATGGLLEGLAEVSSPVGSRTAEIYDLQLRLHILPVLAEGVPALGSIALADLTPELIRLGTRP